RTYSASRGNAPGSSRAPWVRTSTLVAGRRALMQGSLSCHGAASLPLSGRGTVRAQFTPLPVPLGPQSLLQCSTRLPAEAAAELGGVGQGVALVAGPGGLPASRDGPAGQRLQAAEDVPDAGRFAAANIVDFARQGFHRGDGGGHAVGDIGVAAHLLAVAVDD